MPVIKKHNVHIRGNGDAVIMFAHGFGCDQNMWRHVAPAFERTHQVVLFDHIGAGDSDLSAFDPSEYTSLSRYADDVIAILRRLGKQQAVFVGHSVSAMIGVLAANKMPELFSKLVLVGPSPCYINDGDYFGGFERSDINSLLDFLEDNYLGWSQAMAPAIMGNPDRPELGQELTSSFCRTDPKIAKQFAAVTFLSDNRADLDKCTVPALVMQCSDDVIAPIEVGKYMHRHLRGSSFVQLKATGHCPNLSAPEETVAAIKSYI
ncbi:sigma-B regulation protein RsbQ [Noviherbaspirillum humi]|uniref:Sigma-B regulation protein RsbQ n=2 Tax=Noviherbaspirillum humi TaxID=1688639 RepID=A0A239IHC5_9BURK|nr:alpha/beta hydrolase [Noviherbaspirillum humi]SNS91824.1 sigma-B regulation protein RsbQ [Noviherbaspirillum humi]